MTHLDDLITKEIQLEGGATATKVEGDKGGRTQYGISESANPEAWRDNKVTEEEARAIYMQRYVIGPGFDKIPDAKLQAQMVDFGVTSGPQVAIHYLQEVLGVSTDHILGPKTLQALTASTNAKLVGARIQMIARIVAKNPSQLKFLVGWITRALEFL